MAGLVAWQLVNEDTNAAASFDECGVAGVAGAARVVPRQVQVNVYNATNRTGLARAVATQLERRGFAVQEIANDPRRARVKGTAIIRFGASGDPAARLLATQLPQVQLDGDKRRAPVVDLVLGERFGALAPVLPGCGAVLGVR
jgi:hypothetical protein